MAETVHLKSPIEGRIWCAHSPLTQLTQTVDEQNPRMFDHPGNGWIYE